MDLWSLNILETKLNLLSRIWSSFYYYIKQINNNNNKTVHSRQWLKELWLFVNKYVLFVVVNYLVTPHDIMNTWNHLFTFWKLFFVSFWLWANNAWCGLLILNHFTFFFIQIIFIIWIISWWLKDQIENFSDFFSNKRKAPCENIHEIRQQIWMLCVVELLNIKIIFIEFDHFPLIIVGITVVGSWKNCYHQWKLFSIPVVYLRMKKQTQKDILRGTFML